MVEVLTPVRGGSIDISIRAVMNVSVLVVGGEPFLTTYTNRISNLVSGKIALTSRIDEAIAVIKTQQPAVVILQASQVGSREICRKLKEQTHMFWIYCILLEEESQMSELEIEGLETQAIAPETEEWRKEGKRLLSQKNRELLVKAEALESGADAYLQITKVRESTVLSEEELMLQNRLLSAQIQVGLRHVQKYQELNQTNDLLSSIALADPLTQLSNRRALDWELPRQIQNARMRRLPLSLIMLDVDHFKSVNDTYGHLVGDRVLCLLAARLQYNLRVQDSLFRYGGEEFVIILSNTGTQEAFMVANRLRRLLCDQPISIDEALALNITVSLGTASLKPTDDVKGVNLLHRADQNLLQAKNTGRNQVVSEEF